MSLLDKVMSTVTPTETEFEHAQARERAHAAAGTSGWPKLVLNRHMMIDDAFADVRSASSSSGRHAAQMHLAALLTAHAVAEEAVIYLEEIRSAVVHPVYQEDGDWRLALKQNAKPTLQAKPRRRYTRKSLNATWAPTRSRPAAAPGPLL